MPAISLPIAGSGRETLMSTMKEKPRLVHAFILGLLATVFSLFLATGYTWALTARASRSLLNLASISTNYLDSTFTIFVRLLDGSSVGFKILIESSGLISVAIFCFIFVFTIGLLHGSLRTKITWLVLGIAVGLLWNVVRLAFTIGIAYRFGLGAFFLFHYLLSPSIDFIWIVSMWALAMSRLRKTKVVTLP